MSAIVVLCAVLTVSANCPYGQFHFTQSHRQCVTCKLPAITCRQTEAQIAQLNQAGKAEKIKNFNVGCIV